MHLEDCKIIEGYKKIVHEVNTTTIELTLLDLKDKILSRQDDEDEISNVLKRKILQVETNINQIKPRRLRRWDALGRAWKWMSGSPDADDLRIINTDLNKMTDNSNQQIIINDELNQGVNNITDAINKVIISHRKTSTAVDLLNILMNLDILNNEIDHIQDAILLAKLEMISSKILSHHEIELINQILSSQGISPALLDEALSFASATIGTNGEIILFIINIPHFSQSTYQHLKIEPIIFNSQRIKLNGNEYIHGNGKLFLKNGNCQKLGNWSLCTQSKLKDVSEDDCIFKLITGKNSRCNYDVISHHPAVTEMSQTTLLLNEVNDTLRSTCGISDRNLTGSFLITYTNCSVSIRNFSFTNQVIETTNQQFYLPTVGLEIAQHYIEHPTDIHTLNRLHQRNLEHLKKLQLTTDTHRWTLIGGLSSSLTIMLLFIYILFKIKRQTTISITTETKTHSPEEVSKSQSTFLFQPPSLRS